MAIDVKRGIRRLLIVLSVVYWAVALLAMTLHYENRRQGLVMAQISALITEPPCGPDCPPPPKSLEDAYSAERMAFNNVAGDVWGWGAFYAVAALGAASVAWVYRGFRKPKP